jgi:phytoene dehydrogenase-like protein
MSKDISQIHWDNIVVGAGIGGLALAALLSHHGKKFLVVEKNSWVGGRAATFPGDKM